MADLSDANRVLEEIYRPALEEQLRDISWLTNHLSRTKITRRIKFRFWRRRVISNIRDAWYVLWHGPDKWMDW